MNKIIIKLSSLQTSDLEWLTAARPDLSRMYHPLLSIMVIKMLLLFLLRSRSSNIVTATSIKGHRENPHNNLNSH